MTSNLTETLKGEQMTQGRKEEYQYLPTVAGAGQADFISQVRNQPAASPVSSNEMIAERSGAIAQKFQILRSQRCDPYYHSGLNE